MKKCDQCGKETKYLNKHLAQVHKVTDAEERRSACYRAKICNLIKRDLAMQIANLPLTKEDMLRIWDMRQDVKNFLRTKVIKNQRLDQLLDDIIRRVNAICH